MKRKLTIAWPRAATGLATSIATVLVLTGCAAGEAVVGTMISAANKADTALLRSRGSSLLKQHLQMIKELQDKGDPLGDYLWTSANARGWADNPELDPEKLMAMYQAAAEIKATHSLSLADAWIAAAARLAGATLVHKDPEFSALDQPQEVLPPSRRSSAPALARRGG